MGNHLFLWLRNRTTDNRECEKARNIKEKRTIEMFSTVSKPHVALRSSQRDKDYCNYSIQESLQVCLQGSFCVPMLAFAATRKEKKVLYERVMPLGRA